MVDDLHQVVTATESLAAGARLGAGWEHDDEPYVLVCTNGRHDPCCATFGRPLVRALRASRWADRVWECSHIGGDRFAGNLLLLPESLYFGRCDAERAERVLAEYDAGRLDLDLLPRPFDVPPPRAGGRALRADRARPRRARRGRSVERRRRGARVEVDIAGRRRSR